MKRYLLDSNAVSQFVNRREPFARRVREVLVKGCRIGTCEPVVADSGTGIP